MFDDWLPWLVLAISTLMYGLMTLTLSVLQPQGLAAMLGMASTETSDNLNPGSAGDYRATRIVVTTIRSASFIAIVVSGYRASLTVNSTADEVLVMAIVSSVVLIGVITMRMLLNRMASSCYEDVEIWLAPIIWLARVIGRRLQLNRVANYMTDTDNSGDSTDEPVENVLNVLQNLSSKDLRADDLMVPISDMVAVDAETSLEDVIDMMDQLEIDTVVVYDQTIDEVLGTINEAEVLQGIRQGQGGDLPICRDWFSASIFPVPVTQQVATLFDDFQGRMYDTAVMLDEDGKVAGILTFGSLMEQLLRDANLVNEASS